MSFEPSGLRSFQIVLSLTTLSWVLHVNADDLPFLSETAFVEEDPVIFSASRLPQTLRESPVAVTVIDRQMIEASGAQSLPEVFRLVPGFIVGSVNGNRASVTNHGLADGVAREMQVLVDGVVVYIPGVGGTYWHRLPVKLEDVDHIEVVRGPNAATFGANSFLGVINIITKHASQDEGASVSVGAGSRDARKLHLRFGGTHGRLSHRFRLDHRGDDGFKEPAGSPDTDHKRTVDIGTRFDYLAESGDQWEMQFGLSANQTGTGSTTGLASLYDPPRSFDGFYDYEIVRWSSGRSSTGPVSVRFSRTARKIEDTYLSNPFPIIGAIVLSDDSLTERYSIELEKHLLPSDSLHAVFGGELRQDRIESDFLFAHRGGEVEDNLLSVFGNLEWWVNPQWLVQAGAMYEDFDIGGESLSPRFAVNYLPNDRDAFRVSVSKATRVVFPFEEHSRITFGNLFILLNASGGLEPPEIVSHEIGYVGRIPEWRMAIDARLYYDEVKDLITFFVNDSFLLDLRNSDDATLKGVDFQISRLFGEDDRVILGFSHVDIDSTDQGAEFSRSGPRNNVHLLLIKQLSHGWTGSMAYYHLSKMQFTDSDKVPPVNRVDLRAARNFSLGGGMRGQFALVLQNVLDDHLDYSTGNDVGKRAFLELRLEQ